MGRQVAVGPAPPHCLFEFWAEPQLWADISHPLQCLMVQAAAWIYYRDEFREQQAGPDQILTV